MKPLLPLLLICFISISSQAQTELIDLQKLKTNADYLQWFRDKPAVALNNKKPIISLTYGQLFLQGAKPGVYRLPQDGMPCIVPDTKDIVAIPNAFQGKVSVPFAGNPPRIPNAIQPKVFELFGKK